MKGEMMYRRTDEITLGRESVGGNPGSFLVVHVSREGGYFSVTADEYTSRKAFELGNDGAIIACGQLTDDIRDTFPDLGVVLDVHLCDVVTGEPTHARSNGWYYLSGEAAQREMDARANGHKNDYQAPDPYSEGWTAHWRQRAANALHCEPADLPERCNDQEAFNYWVNTVMVPRWKRAADNANAYIDAHKGDSIEIPANQTDEDEFEAELEDGLYVHAKLCDEVDSDILPGSYVYQYDVIVRVDGVHEYAGKFHGSVNDYQMGVVNAREAAFGTLRELNSFLYESAQSLAEDYFEEGWDGISEEQRKAMLKCERAADAMSRQLEANMDVIGV